MNGHERATARLACSWLLTYPDDALLERLPELTAAVATLPDAAGQPLGVFLDHLAGVEFSALQEHYVSIFDMRRRACPYLTYWTLGDTRNRGADLVRFKQLYQHAGFELSDAELPDHLAVVLEFAAVGDPSTGDALLAEHQGPIELLRDALHTMHTPYAHVLDAVVVTLPTVTPALRQRMARLATSGPPTELVGLAPYPTAASTDAIGARR